MTKKDIVEFCKDHSWVPWSLVVFVIFIIGQIGGTSQKHAIEEQLVEWRKFERSLPFDGCQRDYNANEGDRTTYEFESPAPSFNVVVRFFNMNKGFIAADLFIRRGTKMSEISLVNGRYRIVYAYGDDRWYGYKRLWGKRTTFGEAKADTLVDGEVMLTRWRDRKIIGECMWRSSSEDAYGDRSEEE